MAGEEQQQQDEPLEVIITPDVGDGATVGETQRERDKATGQFTKKVEPAATEDEEPIESLRSQLSEMTARTTRSETALQQTARERQDALDRAARAESAAESSRAEILDSQFSTIESGIAAAQSEAEAAEGDYKRAAETGNHDAMAKASRRMAKAEGDIGRLSEAKGDLEIRRSRSSEQTEQRDAAKKLELRSEVKPAQNVDLFENYVQQFSAPTATWLRNHRDWTENPQKSARLQSAHFAAVAEGIAPDTPEYFSHVETAIGLKQSATNGNGQQQQRSQRKQAAPAAPVNGGGNGSGGAMGGGTVTLTAGEARAATDGTHIYNYDDPSGKGRFKKGDPIGVQEFARRKLAMKKDGHYDRTYTEQ